MYTLKNLRKRVKRIIRGSVFLSIRAFDDFNAGEIWASNWNFARRCLGMATGARSSCPKVPLFGGVEARISRNVKRRVISSTALVFRPWIELQLAITICKGSTEIANRRDKERIGRVQKKNDDPFLGPHTCCENTGVSTEHSGLYSRVPVSHPDTGNSRILISLPGTYNPRLPTSS